MRSLIATIALLLSLCAPAYAQATMPNLVVNPTTADFIVSTDHNATTPVSGLPLVSEYRAQYFVLDAQGNPSGQPAFTSSLGKPTPDAQGRVTIVNAFDSLLPNTLYRLVILAVGPGGTTASPASDPFGREQLSAPRAVQKPEVR